MRNRCNIPTVRTFSTVAVVCAVAITACADRSQGITKSTANGAAETGRPSPIPLAKTLASVVTDASGRAAVVRGTWEPETERAKHAAFRPPENSAYIFCSRVAERCYESLAVLTGPMASRIGSDHPMYLESDLTELVVQEWSAAKIVAVAETRATDIRLDVSLVDETAQLTILETSARGATGAAPTPQVWVIKK